MMKNDQVEVSKFLSYILRHRPGEIGIVLDGSGWASVDELIQKANVVGKSLNRELINRVVANNDKKRFSLSSDGSKIRTNQGHSINVDLKLREVSPPDKLYHGTATRFISSIEKEGLVPGSRQHVHLSCDVIAATKVGKRHGKPIVLVIDAKQMTEDGHKFYLSENGIWLTDSVSFKYIRLSKG